MTKILRDPLIYFLLVGLGLFVLFDVVASDEAVYDSRVINVDRDALLTFVQYRSRAFEPQAAAARLDNMPEDELDRMIADYVREEALHAERLRGKLGEDLARQELVHDVSPVRAGASVDRPDVEAAGNRRS